MDNWPEYHSVENMHEGQGGGRDKWGCLWLEASNLEVILEVGWEKAWDGRLWQMGVIGGHGFIFPGVIGATAPTGYCNLGDDNQ